MAIFESTTFELCGSIRNLNKNRSKKNGCTSWLCCLCNSRTNDYADFIELGEEVKNFLDKYK